jgi:hypothetical protein
VLTGDDGAPVCLAQLSGRLPMGSERDLLDTLVKEGDRFNPLGG